MPRFITERAGHQELIVREDVATWMFPVLREVASGFPSYAVTWRDGGRGTVAVITAGPMPVLVRKYHRGGLLAHLNRDLYAGLRPRPVRELEVMETLRSRGAPVAEGLGAVVSWVMPGVYRGWLATRFLTDAVTLWDWCRSSPSAERFEEVLMAAGEAIGQVNECGGYHPDLNLGNVLIQEQPASTTVTVIDFDRGRLDATPGDLWTMIERLRRSAHKLDPREKYLTSAMLVTLADAAALAGQRPG